MKHFLAILFLFLAGACYGQGEVLFGGSPKQVARNRGTTQLDSSVKMLAYRALNDTTILGVGPDGQVYRITKSMISRWGGGLAGFRRTEFSIVAGANSATLTNAALAGMTVSRISYAGRTFNSGAFSKPYSSNSLTLTTAGASFYSGQLITITPDSLTGGGGSGSSGPGYALVPAADTEIVYGITGSDTVRLVSGAAWMGYANTMDLLRAIAENHYSRFVDAQRAASDGAVKPLMTQPLHDWRSESFRAVSGSDTFAVVIHTDWGQQAAADPRSATNWYDENAARLVQFTRIGAVGAQSVRKPSELLTGQLAAMRRINER